MLDDLADLLLGAACPGCGRPGAGLCPRCRALLSRRARPVEDAPGLGPLAGRVWYADPYRSPLDNLLSAHKDRGAWLLGGPLGRQLALAVGALLLDLTPPEGTPVVLVPVPSSARVVRERGLDHARVLARVAARQLGAGPGPRPAVVAALRRVARVQDQSGLGREQRGLNQQGTMRARPPRAPAAAVVVDDVCTTGASLAEADRALGAAGWQVLGAAVVAHPTRSPQRVGTVDAPARKDCPDPFCEKP